MHRSVEKRARLFVADRISEIGFPEKQDYYQVTSVDGYALLGAAKALLGMDCLAEAGIVFNGEAIGLRDSYAIQGQHFDGYTEYLYSCWVASIFAELYDRKYLQQIKDIVGKFTLYTDGIAYNAISYTYPDCNYIVPNVQAMAYDLHYAGYRCLKWLEKNIHEGNWRYGFRQENHFIERKEDIPHLGFICLALRNKPLAKRVIDTAEATMNKLYESGNDKSRISNLHPVFALATSKQSLKIKALGKTVDILCNESENFRARCWAAYSLAKSVTEGYDEKLYLAINKAHNKNH